MFSDFPVVFTHHLLMDIRNKGILPGAHNTLMEALLTDLTNPPVSILLQFPDFKRTYIFKSIAFRRNEYVISVQRSLMFGRYSAQTKSS